MEHPPVDVILRSLSDEADEEDRIVVDSHVVDCLECRKKVKRLLHIRENFDSLWEGMNAVDHGRLFRKWRLAVALEEAAKREPSLAAKAQHWLRAVTKGVDTVIKVLVDRERRIVAAAAEALPQEQEFVRHSAVAGVGTSEEQARIQDHLRRGSDLLARNQREQAVDELMKAVEIDARSPQAVTSQVVRRDDWVVQVVADSRRGRISVKYKTRAKGRGPSLAVLLHHQAGHDLVAPFEAVESEGYDLAEFEDVPSGWYRIEIGPFVDDT